jgi:hypothetical protein
VAAKTGKKAGDDALAKGLAMGLGVPQAAQAAGLSERTAYRRLEDPAFRRRVDEQRAALVGETTGALAALGQRAAATLGELLRSDDKKVRLGAVRTALEFIYRANEQDTLARHLRELRAELEESRRGRTDDDPGGGAAAGGGPAPETGNDPALAAAASGPGGHLQGGAHDPGLLASEIAPLDLGPDAPPLFPTVG